LRGKLRVEILPTYTTKNPSTHIEIKTSPPEIKDLDTGKGIASEAPKKSKGKKCFKHVGYRHFKLIIPIERPLPLGR